jgi:hypothetical protein
MADTLARILGAEQKLFYYKKLAALRQGGLAAFDTVVCREATAGGALALLHEL